MKRTFLAALTATAVFALARADDGAYLSLIGMARSAKTDRGPDAGAAPERRSAAVQASKTDGPGASGAEADDGAALRDAVAQPLVPKPRLWTRLYATLLPPWRRTPALQDAFEPAVSTSAARVRRPLPALMPPPDSESVKAGERRGLAELLSASAAPSGVQ